MASTDTRARKYCSTSQAAQRLGVSMGSVQQMVESGVLEAWKTAGGHRRILVDSVEAFLSRSRTGSVPVARPGSELYVLIAEDDEIMCKLYRHQIDAWRLPLRLELASNGVDALMAIGRCPPDLLIADLRMPGLDGFEMLRRLASSPLTLDMDIVVVTGLTEAEIEENGGLPPGVTVYGKPVPFRELRGYVQAKVSQIQRLQRMRSG